jgi:hypothetical protein
MALGKPLWHLMSLGVHEEYIVVFAPMHKRDFAPVCDTIQNPVAIQQKAPSMWGRNPLDILMQ